MTRVLGNLFRHKLLAIASFAVVFHGAAELALAQKPGRVPDQDGGMTQWLIAVGIVVVVSLSAFINPKRSHLS